MQYKQTMINGYSISEYGDVYSEKSKRLLKPYLHHKGYKRIRIGGINCFIHRLVAQAFVPNPNNLPQVNHIDGDKLNNHYTNLEWCTNEYNQQHAIDNNLNAGFIKGEQHTNAKLSNDNALIIKRLAHQCKAIELAKQYNIATITVYKIWKGEMWKHL